MGKKKTTGTARRPSLKKETLRKLDAVALADEHLRLVNGGYLILAKAPTYPCKTSN